MKVLLLPFWPWDDLGTEPMLDTRQKKPGSLTLLCPPAPGMPLWALGVSPAPFCPQFHSPRAHHRRLLCGASTLCCPRVLMSRRAPHEWDFAQSWPKKYTDAHVHTTWSQGEHHQIMNLRLTVFLLNLLNCFKNAFESMKVGRLKRIKIIYENKNTSMIWVIQSFNLVWVNGKI